MANKKAVILLSGGLDSTTTLYYAKAKGFKCFCLLFDYGQRHKKELKAAVKLAKMNKCIYIVVKIALPWSKSALTDRKVKVPVKNKQIGKDIPVTYVPARNTIFLGFAASYAESIGAKKIFIGANALDYSGYPDCRPNYIKAYEKAVNLGTKSGVSGNKLKIETPLINLTKAEIIKLGIKLKVPYELTWSCYNGGKKPCGVCDSCLLREKGFRKIK
ncbi:MAG: 7-cyano-7-deazaguanine synthase QueC [Candidatus Firestonebacteria bacterium RIFOXYC2_FULL_39_67]|nr:MAG: 7-cyano-7-deazaguanine synthase QueC [Candidatus Firestonebacteria bacterium RIFOXYD2_FULL_39_29]OGF54776.1 MAG: 7-cyano-7-deazaguanine synthase QueC [Candidatus Firestonebacteria bacterium RIFOXYC2_FULL_39_67]OGF58077.1 MAG: 7-cyano-7-deazaguanine synthase QueC [Candidatus Firestonebacteria bacterium RifOxyC12_full_39_7]